MKMLLYVAMSALLLSAAVTFAADVDYQHPNITIVASNERLDSVLKSVSKEMPISVTTPSGVNPIVNCDIQNQPLEKAFKTLMGGMSYSLEWKNDGQQLIGLTILSGSEGPDAATAGANVSNVAPVKQVSVMPAETHGASSGGRPIEPYSDRSSPVAYDNAEGAETRDRDDGLKAGIETQEIAVRELGEREIELELRRQEEVIAQEARMEEERARNQAEMAEYFETYGISPNP